MTSKQIIDEVADDRVWLVSQFRYDPANQSVAPSVPLQVNRPMRGFAMDFRPAVWTPRALVFGRNQIKPPKLGIGHDLFSQRSSPGSDDLNHGLHFTPTFSRKSLPLQCLFRTNSQLLRHVSAPHTGATTTNLRVANGT
jgi:hypothetical protein